MDKPARTSGLLHRWLGRPTPAATTDAADLGTCFGLDLSLTPTPLPAPPPRALQARTGWTGRLRLRTRIGP